MGDLYSVTCQLNNALILSAEVAPYLIFWNLWIAYFFHLSAIAANVTVLLSLSFAMSCAPFQIISSNINALFTLVCNSRVSDVPNT